MILSGSEEAFWNCGECRESGLDQSRGCNGGSKHILVDAGMSFDECPRAWMQKNALVVQLVDDAIFCLSNKIPYTSGGLLEQPALFIDTVSIINRVGFELRKWQERRQGVKQ